MLDPFAVALGALFRAPGSAAAVYQAPGQGAEPIRVIRAQADAVSSFGRGKLVQGTNTLSIQRSDVPRPVAGAIVQIGTEVLRLVGAPQLDAEGLTWDCGAEPA